MWPMNKKNSELMSASLIDNSQVFDVSASPCMGCCILPCLVSEMTYLLDLVVGVKVDDLAKGLLQSCNEFFHDFRLCV